MWFEARLFWHDVQDVVPSLAITNWTSVPVYTVHGDTSKLWFIFRMIFGTRLFMTVLFLKLFWKDKSATVTFDTNFTISLKQYNISLVFRCEHWSMIEYRSKNGSVYEWLLRPPRFTIFTLTAGHDWFISLSITCLATHFSALHPTRVLTQFFCYNYFDIFCYPLAILTTVN